MSAVPATPAAELPEGARLTYIVNHETWYWPAQPPVITKEPCIAVVAAALGGGCHWEFSINEVDLGRQPAIRLEMFDDAFDALVQIPEFFRRLPEVDTLAGVRELLDELGAVDETARVRP